MTQTPTNPELNTPQCSQYDHRVVWAGDCYLCDRCNTKFVPDSAIKKEALKARIEQRIKIASTETKSSDEVVQIAWLADGIKVWFDTGGSRGNSPTDARRYIISSITRLLEKEALKARQNEIATTCIAGVGGLTPEQQVFFEKRLADLEKELGSK